jgi:hypothetical protein
VGSFTFWFGARRVQHRWYSALIAGAVVFVIAATTLSTLSPVLSLWRLLFAIEIAMAVLGFLFGLMPSFPKARK